MIRRIETIRKRRRRREDANKVARIQRALWHRANCFGELQYFTQGNGKEYYVKKCTDPAITRTPV
jgi:hypothetical protein